MQCWSIEGNRQRLDGGAMYGNVPRALWSRWTQPDENNSIELACRGLFVDGLAGQRVLFETGIGAFFEPHLKARFGVWQPEHVLLQSLQTRGISHEDVDAVVLSHLHFDHAGGLLAAWEEGRPHRLLFPNARYLIGAQAWQRAVHPHARDRASFIPELIPLLKESGRLELVTGEYASGLGDEVRFSYSEGHTPGLMHAELGGPGGIVFCSDLIPGRPWVHLPVTMGYDRYPERLIDEKQRFLEDKIERGLRLYFTHDLECALAQPARDPQGRFHVVNEQSKVEGLML